MKKLSNINNVTKEECMEALEFLHVEGFVEEMTSDKRHYVTILLKKVANDYNIVLTNEYPFQEGDDYYTIEGREVIWSCWDDQSELFHDESPNRVYYRTREEALLSIILTG